MVLEGFLVPDAIPEDLKPTNSNFFLWIRGWPLTRMQIPLGQKMPKPVTLLNIPQKKNHIEIFIKRTGLAVNLGNPERSSVKDIQH